MDVGFAVAFGFVLGAVAVGSLAGLVLTMRAPRRGFRRW